VDRLRYALIYPAAEPESRGREDLEREVIMPEKTAFVLAPAIEALPQEERFNLLSPERFSTRTCLASGGHEVSHAGGGNRGGSRAGAVRTDIR
jgi:hypothetical protein